MNNKHMSDSSQTQSLLANDDEIDLVDLFRKIWSQRGLIAGIVIATVCLVMAYHLAKATFYSTKRIDYPITIVFLDSSHTYPDGTAFSPFDLVNTRLVAEIAERYSMQPARLSQSLSVSNSNALLSMGEEKLASFLQNAKTPNEVVEQVNQSLTEIRQETRKALTLSIDINKSGLNPEQASRLLADLAETWASRAIEAGKMNVDLGYPASQLQLPATKNLVDVYDQVYRYADSLRVAMDEFSKLSGANSLILHGNTITDVKRELLSKLDYDIKPLRSFAYSSADVLSGRDPGLQVRILSRKRDLELENRKITKLIAAYSATLNQLSNKERQVFQNETGLNGPHMTGAQLDQTFFNSMLELGDKLSAVEMREEIYRMRNTAIENQIELEKELEILSAGPSEYDMTETIALLEDSKSRLVDELNKSQLQLMAFVNEYASQVLKSGSNLYLADSAPQARGGTLVVDKKALLTIVLGGFLGLLVGIVVALLRVAIKKSDKAQS